MASERRKAARPGVIRASEIGEYVYCAHAWWLRRVVGLEPAHQARLERGRRLHQRHGQALAGSRLLLGLALALLLVALLLVLVGR